MKELQLLGMLSEIIDRLNSIELAISKTLPKKRGHKRVDLTGQVFGNLTVEKQGLDYREKKSNRLRTTWDCKCVCGSLVSGVLTTNLQRGNSTSCGCSRTQHNHTLHRTKTPTYSTWNAMRTRCENPCHASFKNYGAKGIEVCERWKTFTNFLEDMGERPDGHEIHRLDQEKGYEPGNCEWMEVSTHRKLHRRS